MYNIAIDGTAGSGKSTIARLLAKKLNFKVFNTGDLYRCFACAYLDFGYHNITESAIKDFINRCDIKVQFMPDGQHTFVNNIDYTSRLHEEEISVLSSKIAPFKKVRKKVKKVQRQFAKENDCVMEGRDICTFILPHADLKLFITARPEVRAKRRYAQAKEEGKSYEDILRDINQRDYSDTHRKVAPLKPAKDGIIVDNSDMTVEETVDYCEELFKEKVGR